MLRNSRLNILYLKYDDKQPKQNKFLKKKSEKINTDRKRQERREKEKSKMPTTPGIPRRSPIQVLTGLDVA